MPGQSFRFLHAGGFRLHQAIRGLSEVSDAFQALLAEAPFESVTAVVSTALREEVDFMVLVGDLLDPTSAGPRAISFLREQFSVLKESGIAVYWAASRCDSEGDWQNSLEWPDNVQIFAADHAERLIHARSDVPLAELVGRSWLDRRPFRPAEFELSSRDSFRIAVLPDSVEVPAARTSVDYWALGGTDSATTQQESGSFVHCPGSILGMAPNESGVHGCTLVDVDSEGGVRTRMIATDAVRWCHERIQVSLAMSRSLAQQAIRARVKHLLAEIAKPMLVVWSITGDSRFDTLFVQAEDRAEILAWLREEYSTGTPPLWSVDLELEPPEQLPPEWCEEDSILGDYLRVVQKYEAEPETPLNLGEKLQGTPPRELVEALSLSRPDVRSRLLQSAALLGADLLRGDESPDH